MSKNKITNKDFGLSNEAFMALEDLKKSNPDLDIQAIFASFRKFEMLTSSFGYMYEDNLCRDVGIIEGNR